MAGFPKARYVLALLGFWGCFNLFALRLNLSVAIVDMVEEDWTPEYTHGINGTNTTFILTGRPEFDWDEITQGLILGCYFYGHGLFHLPGGRLSEMVSPKLLYGWAMLATAILSLVSPPVARWSTGAFVALRAIQGILSGMAWPVLHTLLARWFPRGEMAFLSTFVYTGRLVGAAATMEFSGLMISGDVLGGWPSTFYIFGILGIVWFIFWMFLVYDIPDVHPRVSDVEVDYIKKNTDGHNSSVTYKVPWSNIFRSAPVWALCVSHFGNSYGLETMMLLLPTYMSNILGYDIETNGHLSALPFLVDALAGFLAAYVADCTLRRKLLSVTAVRKAWCAFAYLGAAGCFLGVAYVGQNAVGAVVLFLLALGFSGIAAPSVFVVQIDMAPDFAGTLMGLSSFFGSIAGIIAPYVVGILTENQPTLERWRIAFYIIVGVYVLTTIVFVAFGSAELQPWGLADTKRKGSKEESSDSTISEKTPLLEK